jgi:hypothetical protein
MNELQTMHPDEIVISKIYFLRGLKVMLDQDLAELYGVETRVLKQQVRRNIERFPEDFMFELTHGEFNLLTDNMRSQNVISSWKTTTYKPFAFTEQGVAMLSSVLKSKQAILVNIQIMRVFTKMRKLLETHTEILKKLEKIERKDIEQDEKIMLIFEYLKQLEKNKQEYLAKKSRPKIGFIKD